jgi:DNA-dependent protein kinase catalytic subunit
MFEAMYSPSTEQYFLSYATNLVLEMTSKSPDYQREIGIWDPSCPFFKIK